MKTVTRIATGAAVWGIFSLVMIGLATWELVALVIPARVPPTVPARSAADESEAELDRMGLPRGLRP